MSLLSVLSVNGREVTEFVDMLRASHKKKNACWFCHFRFPLRSSLQCGATGDNRIGIFFVTRKSRLCFYPDSMTRYARALRDVALASGERPARRGYPASVFDNLPRLLERGATSEEALLQHLQYCWKARKRRTRWRMKSLYHDGHLYLSRKLAGQGHYPAIDVLKSVSRVFGQVTATPTHMLNRHLPCVN